MYKQSTGLCLFGNEARRIDLYGLSDLIDLHKFIGGMAAAALARTHLEAGERHEGLVAEGRGAERLAAKFYNSTHEGMADVDA